jgi:hypothetical protein
MGFVAWASRTAALQVKIASVNIRKGCIAVLSNVEM